MKKGQDMTARKLERKSTEKLNRFERDEGQHRLTPLPSWFQNYVNAVFITIRQWENLGDIPVQLLLPPVKGGGSPEKLISIIQSFIAVAVVEDLDLFELESEEVQRDIHAIMLLCFLFGDDPFYNPIYITEEGFSVDAWLRAKHATRFLSILHDLRCWVVEKAVCLMNMPEEEKRAREEEFQFLLEYGSFDSLDSFYEEHEDEHVTLENYLVCLYRRIPCVGKWVDYWSSMRKEYAS